MKHSSTVQPLFESFIRMEAERFGPFHAQIYKKIPQFFKHFIAYTPFKLYE